LIELIRSIPQQLEYSWEKSADILTRVSSKSPSLIAVCGMGGSGVSGDILRGLLLRSSPIAIEVVKDYQLPVWVNNSSFAVVISYSGNTEETLALWKTLRERDVPSLAVSSGGELKKLAEAENIPLLQVPSGNPPRASIGYLLAPLLRLVHYWGLYPSVAKDLQKAISLINLRVSFWEDEMRSLARSLNSHFCIIHALDASFLPLAYRLVCQLNENAKVLAHAHFYSEMNHNEIMGFQEDMQGNILILNLDMGVEFTHSRNIKRAEIVRKIISPSIPKLAIKAEGDSLLERTLSLLIKGDLLSVFLAELRGIDPMPVRAIESLKKELA